MNVSVSAVILPPVANPSSPTVAFKSSNDSLALNITGGVSASVAITAGPSHGTASVNGVSAITYLPTHNYYGADVITCQATNISGSSSANLSVTVSPPATMSVSIGAGSSSSANASGFTFAANTITVTGGSGSFTYLWSNTNDGHGTWTTGGTGASFSPAVSGVTGGTGCVSTANYPVTVTDTVTHATANSNVAIYTFTNTGKACSQ